MFACWYFGDDDQNRPKIEMRYVEEYVRGDDAWNAEGP